MDAAAVSLALHRLATPEKARASAWFFKSGPGEYAEGDTFLGVTVPEIRQVAKQYRDLRLKQIEKLVKSPWHEERLCGLLLLVDQYNRGDEGRRKAIYDFYMSHTKYVNNWDLVDLSAEFIVGPWLEDKPNKREILIELASSDWLWDRRIALLATFHYIKQGKLCSTLAICEKLLHDKHDLIQKATGWMLREVGKRVDEQVLRDFLDTYAATMPRTTLRYAIEHFEPDLRAQYLGAAKAKLGGNGHGQIKR